MKLEPGTESSRGTAAYTSPNDPFAGTLEPRIGAAVPGAIHGGVHSAIEVIAPRDLVRRADAPAATGSAVTSGVDPAEHEQVRLRVSFLEGALESSAKVEAAAREFADRVEERARASRERYEKDTGDLRQQIDTRERDLREQIDTRERELREQLDTRERELRTLALEMGKLQGRLEVTQQRLLAPRETNAPQGALDATRHAAPLGSPPPAPPRSFLESERGLFLSGVVVAVAIVVVVSLLR